MPLLLLLYMSEIKLKFMKHALELGEQVRNKTGDNPWVGCGSLIAITTCEIFFSTMVSAQDGVLPWKEHGSKVQ